MADSGISMGITRTEVSKCAAVMILTDGRGAGRGAGVLERMLGTTSLTGAQWLACAVAAFRLMVVDETMTLVLRQSTEVEYPTSVLASSCRHLLGRGEPLLVLREAPCRSRGQPCMAAFRYARSLPPSPWHPHGDDDEPPS